MKIAWEARDVKSGLVVESQVSGKISIIGRKHDDNGAYLYTMVSLSDRGPLIYLSSSEMAERLNSKKQIPRCKKFKMKTLKNGS